MILYRIGEIVYKRQNNLIFESQGIGYSLIFPNHERVSEKAKLKLYIYEIKNDYYQATYAFKEFKERLLFTDLIGIAGIGPRVAFNILNHGWEKVVAYIANGNYEELVKIPYLNPKVARLVVVELQNKWQKISSPDKNNEVAKNISIMNEATETLKMLGFKKNQIESALAKANETTNVELLIEEAIKIMSTKYESTSA
ncbi:Holliday junction branch migration protein RuvA [Mycoplasma sp. Mirounga ES2805-ORL]|uniref:Holliday junction branch migration protein RuvA n=1 Tax=Mycoplasma sp. Mirounga ES2805-ORL TaxID=754514 RepID=UPI00197B9D66|nr:Holliday junction branch migration protein RuvA [Mycoplasma sp. Mirounga ES2805-ORL]QSF13685.1 Holliday junction branch migration protein RuvA [Mycoplasma sp. Mirounga ES2805-ORL]